jgi:hypothetical protein
MSASSARDQRFAAADPRRPPDPDAERPRVRYASYTIGATPAHEPDKGPNFVPLNSQTNLFPNFAELSACIVQKWSACIRTESSRQGY